MTLTDIAPSRSAPIRTATEVRAVAAALADRLRPGAADRDARRIPADPAVADLAASGLLGITVPRRLGGADADADTVAEAVRLLAAADAAIGQIPQSHFVFLEAVRAVGTPQQQEFFFGLARTGLLVANAQAERTGSAAHGDRTTLAPAAGGGYLLDGEKCYATGSRYADWLAVRAVTVGTGPDPGPRVVAFVPADAPGVSIEDDWRGMGQRATASGTVRLVDVAVPATHVLPYDALFRGPTTYGAFAQLLHAAIDAGIARGALREAVAQAAGARPWFESDADRAVDDPLLAQQAGEAEITVRAAEALLREAGATITAARADPTDAATAAASIATATAKVAAARAALAATTVLFDLSGARGTDERLNLSRYWRDARTHTLHDPVRWKVQHVGRWVLDGTPPPRHGLL